MQHMQENKMEKAGKRNREAVRIQQPDISEKILFLEGEYFRMVSKLSFLLLPMYFQIPNFFNYDENEQDSAAAYQTDNTAAYHVAWIMYTYINT